MALTAVHFQAEIIMLCLITCIFSSYQSFLSTLTGWDRELLLLHPHRVEPMEICGILYCGVNRASQELRAGEGALGRSRSEGLTGGAACRALKPGHTCLRRRRNTWPGPQCAGLISKRKITELGIQMQTTGQVKSFKTLKGQRA